MGGFRRLLALCEDLIPGAMPRSEMPQIPEDRLEDFFHFLSDRGVGVRSGEARADSLLPCQAEFDHGKVRGIADGSVPRETLFKPVVVAADSYILDGHHRWAGILTLDPRMPVRTWRADCDIYTLFDLALRFGGSEYRAVDESSAGHGVRRQLDPDRLHTIQVGGRVDGLTVGSRVDNTGSIAATLDDWEEIKGLRIVSMSEFDISRPYNARDLRYCQELAAVIGDSGRIDPLIVVYDHEGYYVLEGGHRLYALSLLGKKAFPALVVLDVGSLGPRIVDESANTRRFWLSPEGDVHDIGTGLLGDYSSHDQFARKVLGSPNTEDELIRRGWIRATYGGADIDIESHDWGNRAKDLLWNYLRQRTDTGTRIAVWAGRRLEYRGLIGDAVRTYFSED